MAYPENAPVNVCMCKPLSPTKHCLAFPFPTTQNGHSTHESQERMPPAKISQNSKNTLRPLDFPRLASSVFNISSSEPKSKNRKQDRLSCIFLQRLQIQSQECKARKFQNARNEKCTQPHRSLLARISTEAHERKLNNDHTQNSRCKASQQRRIISSWHFLR